MSLPMIINKDGNNKTDDILTPAHVWKDIEMFIPKDKIIYQPFYYDGSCKKILDDLGCVNVIHREIDYFKNELTYDCVIDNPPFSLKQKILTKLKNDNTPFILLMPVSTMNTQYFRKLFGGDKNMQLIIPKKRISFISTRFDEVERKNNCCFDVNYYCWKMDLPCDINWLV